MLQVKYILSNGKDNMTKTVVFNIDNKREAFYFRDNFQ